MFDEIAQSMALYMKRHSIFHGFTKHYFFDKQTLSGLNPFEAKNMNVCFLYCSCRKWQLLFLMLFIIIIERSEAST